MVKKREGREDRRKKTGDPACDLDNGYTSGIQSIGDISPAGIRSLLASSRYAQILLSLTLVGAVLRFFNLGFNSLWLDEASTLTFARMSIPEIWQATTAGEFNPPLFYWIEHVMLTFGTSEAVLRFVPALLGVLTIPLVYYVGKEYMDRNVGIIAAALCTFSPFLLFYSQEARAYSMGLFFVAFAMVFFLRALKTDNLTHWCLFGVLSAFAFWSHFYTLVVIGTLFLYALGVKIPAMKKELATIKPLVAAGAVFAVVCLPLILVTIQLFAKRTAGGATFGIQGPEIILETFRQLSGYTTWLMYLFLFLFVVGVIQAFLLDQNKGILLVLLLVLPFAISWFLSFSIPMSPRYLIVLAPAFFIGIALAYKPLFTFISNRGIVYAFMAVLVLLSVTTPFFMGYYTTYTKEDWRGLSQQMYSIAGPGDSIVLVPGYIIQPFDYYYSNASGKTLEYGASTAEELAALMPARANTTTYYIVTADISSADPSGDTVKWLEEHVKGIEATPGIYLFTSG